MSETVTLRPNAIGSFDTWAALAALAKWEEIAQEALDPGGTPSTSRGIKSPAELNKRQSFHFTMPTLSGGQKYIGLAVHINGKITAKLKPNLSDQGLHGALTETEMESSASISGWFGATSWTNVKGAGTGFPWTPYTQAALEARGSGENIQLTFNTGKASAQEVFEVYIVVTIEGGAAPQVAASATAGAVVSATVARVARTGAAGTSAAQVSAGLLRLARTLAASSSGATVSIAGLVKTERGPQTAKLSSGAVTAATVARKAQAQAAATAGALVRATALRQAQTAARASAGAVVAASAHRVAQSAPRVSGGAVVSATVRRVTRITAVVTAAPGVRASASAHLPLRASFSSGVSVRANVTRVGQGEEPPTSTPIAGHVAIGQRGNIGVHRGRIPTGNIGRAER